MTLEKWRAQYEWRELWILEIIVRVGRRGERSIQGAICRGKCARHVRHITERKHDALPDEGLQQPQPQNRSNQKT